MRQLANRGNAQLTPYVSGIQRNKTKVVALNRADMALLADGQVWDAAVAGGMLQNMCCPAGRRRYEDPPWIKMPAEGIKFRNTGTPPLRVSDLPLDVTGDAFSWPILLQTQVPDGYDGVITDLVISVVGPAGASSGYVDGSQTLHWFLRVNRERYLRNLANIVTQVGSLQNTGSAFRDSGYIVRSGNLIELLLYYDLTMPPFPPNQPDPLLGLNPDAYIITSIGGWWYPRQTATVL